MAHFAVSVVGRDRPGIVAAVTRTLLDHEVNIEDSQMTVLRGHFTMMLVLAAPPGADLERLRDDLEVTREHLELEALTLSELAELTSAAHAPPSHIVSVYGADHPGIVHAVASTLAERSVNITDLTTRLSGEGEQEPLYLMMLEVALPQGLTVQELEDVLSTVAVRQGVDVTISALDEDAL